LALTRFFSIIESSTTNVWNAKNAFLSPPSRVIWTLDHMKVIHSSSADQSNLGVDVSIHVELCAISGRNPPQAFLKWIAGVFFQVKSLILLQAWSAGVVRPWLYKYIVCDCWLLFVLDLIESVDVVRPRVFFDLQACNVKAWNESIVCPSAFGTAALLYLWCYSDRCECQQLYRTIWWLKS